MHRMKNLSLTETFYEAGNVSQALIYTDKFSEVASYASLEDREGVFRLQASVLGFGIFFISYSLK